MKDPLDKSTTDAFVSEQIGGAPLQFTPPPISGYRVLSENDVKVINGLKAKGQELYDMLLFLATFQTPNADLPSGKQYDPRWANIAITHLHQAVMAGVRAVAQPTGV